jgi:hypothetical protein
MNELYVRSDGSGENPGWKLVAVVVSEIDFDGAGSVGKSWSYKFNTWFTRDVGLQHRSRLGVGLVES